MARCTVERLMTYLGLTDAVRGKAKAKATTTADAVAIVPAGSGRSPLRPGRTESALGGGYDIRVDVVGVRLRRVCHRRLCAANAWLAGGGDNGGHDVLDSVEQARCTRQREGIIDLKDVVHHTDRGSPGGFNWSSQHLDCGDVPAAELEAAYCAQ